MLPDILYSKLSLAYIVYARTQINFTAAVCTILAYIINYGIRWSICVRLKVIEFKRHHMPKYCTCMYARASVRVYIVLLYMCKYIVVKEPECNHVCVTVLTFI